MFVYISFFVKSENLLYKFWIFCTRWNSSGVVDSKILNPKDQVATKDKSNIVYEIDCSSCKAVYFSEFKQSLKSHSDERNCNCEKNEIAKHCWEADYNFRRDQKKVVDRESRLISRKIKETIHSLKIPNHINKISYTLLQYGFLS